LSLYIAEHFFAFDRVNDQVMSNTANAASMVDLNTFDRGQYVGWFNAPVAAPNTNITDQQVTDIANLLSMADSNLQATLTAGSAGSNGSTITPLADSAMPGEAPECAQLRSELSRFYNALAFEDVSLGGLGMNSTGATTNNTGANDINGTNGTTGATPVPP